MSGAALLLLAAVLGLPWVLLSFRSLAREWKEQEA